jgi:hypothetical protein
MSNEPVVGGREPLGVIGYRLEVKFDDLNFLGADIEDYTPADKKELYERLKSFRGLVLFHGYFGQALEFIDNCGEYLSKRQFIVLFFSTDSLVSTVDECKKLSPPATARDCEKLVGRADLFPYMHLLNSEVPSSPSQQIKQRFKALVDAVLNLDGLDDENEIRDLWNIIEPSEEKDADKKLMAYVKDLERVIMAGEFDKASSPGEHVSIVREHYPGGELPDYQMIRQDYLSRCRALRLKKN